MSKWFQIGIHRSSSTAYMIKRLGGADNVSDVQRLETVGQWTYYKVSVKDPLLLRQYAKSCLRIKPL